MEFEIDPYPYREYRTVIVTVEIPHVPDYIEDTEALDGVSEALKGHTDFCDEATITVRSRFTDNACWDCGARNRTSKARFLFWLYDVDTTNHAAGCRRAAYLNGEYNAIGG